MHLVFALAYGLFVELTERTVSPAEFSIVMVLCTVFGIELNHKIVSLYKGRKEDNL